MYQETEWEKVRDIRFMQEILKFMKKPTEES